MIANIRPKQTKINLLSNNIKVVCAFGRNNAPLCQSDGTWTDIPRCIEHDPGNKEQEMNICPGIPGYCSNDWTGGLCEFDCLTGADIRCVKSCCYNI